MKRFVFIFAILLLVCLCACSADESMESGTTETCVRETVLVPQGGEILSEGEYYRVKLLEGRYYYYEIFDREHNVVKSDGPLGKTPRVTMVDDTLLELAVQSGASIGTRGIFYYDVENDRFSETFYAVFDEHDGKLAYVDFEDGVHSIVVRDIFDSKIDFCRISSFREPFSPMVDPFVTIKFSEYGDVLYVSYRSGKEYRLVSETIPIDTTF